MRTIITQASEINKFFYEKSFDFLTSVPRARIQEIILASIQKGNTGKTTDFAEVSTVHRTTYGHFLSKGKWDDIKVDKTQKRESFHAISQLAWETDMPICVSIDDTIVKKTKPSSRAKRPTEEAGWHFSHLEQKVVYGYQLRGNKSFLCHSALLFRTWYKK